MKGKVKIFYGPPGTGKTTRLIRVLEEELAGGVAPDRIAYISFTRKAVQEATGRVVDRFKLRPEQMKYFKTLHALCYALLGMGDGDLLQRKHYKEMSSWLGVEISGTGVMDSGDWARTKDGDKFMFLYSLARAKMEPVREEVARGWSVDWWGLKYAIDGYEKYKGEYQLLDFTDLLEQALLEPPMENIDVAIVDEAQDLSPLQWAVVKHLFQNTGKVYIAGDDDQAIYEWNGATPRELNRIAEGATEVEVLEHSWRLPLKILKASQRIIHNVATRYPKTVTPREGGSGTMDWAFNTRQLPLDNGEEWLLLARNRYMLAQYSDAAREKGLFFSIGSELSVKRKHLACMISWTHLRKGKSVKVRDIVEVYDLMNISPPNEFRGMAKDHLLHLGDLRKTYGLKVKGSWDDLFEGIDLQDREYYSELIRSGVDVTKEPHIHINTIHSTKGGEATNVALMMDMSPSTWAHYQHTPDPEHRVFYVGATRARESLYIVEPQTERYYDDL